MDRTEIIALLEKERAWMLEQANKRIDFQKACLAIEKEIKP